jgi:hypothetical protein
MEDQIQEIQRAQAISPRFDSLNQLVYLISSTTAVMGIAASLLFNNPGVAIASLGSAGFSWCALSSNRERASHTAATLLIQNDEAWEHQIAEVETQIHTQARQLAEVQTQMNERQRQIDALNAEISRLQRDRQSIEATLSQRLTAAQQALEQSQTALLEKRHELAVHLEAVENEILEVWEPLYSGLIAICDRFDPNRPVPELEYAGKPVTLNEDEKRQWHHYRHSLTTYDAGLRDRISQIHTDCESHDEAYRFFVQILEEISLNYCKLWANIKDLELLTVHETEKRAIYSEFENFRSHYVSEASTWVEQSTKVEAGFGYIEESFKHELASLQQRIVDAERLIESLQAPRQFRGETSIDKAGNRIIEHFASSGVIVDAIESVKIPGGFQLRFKVDRNPDRTRLTESEFDKHCEHMGLWGLSQRPLDFELDTRNFLLSVNLYAIPDSKQRSSPLAEVKRSSIKADPPASEVIAERFQALDCYSAAEFEEVVQLKFVPRVRVVAGSTGGKSPLLELITCAIARTHGGEIWLINPVPGSPKDWFHIPGVIPPGSDGIQAAIAWLQKAHDEFKHRRNDLPGTASQPFITVMVDEINAIARDYADLGTVMKDFYQLSDHTRMGFLTAGQGGNVSSVSGGSKAAAKTGNASKLMEEDFQNATQVFTAAAAKTWIQKHLKGAEGTVWLDRLTALNQLCNELNQAEGKSAYPADPTSKKVSPDAYRIALVVSPRAVDPFFIQLPPYSHYYGQMDGMSYPKGAIVTAPEANRAALELSHSAFTCAYCGCNSKRRKGAYKTGKPKYICSQCGRVPSPLD